MPIYKMTGRAHLKDMGRFFRRVGTNIFRFMPRELIDSSTGLLNAVQEYVPVDTGTLKSSLVAQANYNSIQVVAQSIIMRGSAYRKDYAEYVEAGVFGKDMSKMIKTPHRGGSPLVRAPGTIGEEGYVEGSAIARSQLEAQKTTHGYAQFMRAGIYRYFPILMRNLSKIILPKYKSHGRTFER